MRPGNRARENAPRPIRAALYMRVSTDRQAEEGYSIEVQREKLTAFAQSLERQVATELYIDDGWSGASLERPAMERLISDVTEGRLTHVCVYRLDRLSRSQKDTLHLIEDVFLPGGVAFISVQESFNTATAFGRAVVGILSVFAQLERENIYERTRSGMIKRVEAGYWPGGGGVPFGYDYDRERGVLVPNADAPTVRRIYELYIAGMSLQKIADLLGLKYEKLAEQILERRTNYGAIEYRGEEYQGRHEAIVSRELYEEAMAIKRRRSEQHIRAGGRHLLTGLLYCGVCGARMRYQKWGDRGFRLVCYSRQLSKPYLVRDPDCDNEPLWAEDVEAAVISDIFALTAQRIEPGESAVSTEELLEKKIQTLSTKLRRLYELYAENGNEVLRQSIAKLTAEIDSAQGALDREREVGAVSKAAARAGERLLNVRSTWDYMSLEEKRELICSVVDRITLTHRELEIDYRF